MASDFINKNGVFGVNFSQKNGNPGILLISVIFGVISVLDGFAMDGLVLFVTLWLWDPENVEFR